MRPAVTGVRNPVLFLLVAVGTAGIGLLGFVTVSPNRLLSGRPLALWHAADPILMSVVAILALSLLALSLVRKSRSIHQVALTLAGVLALVFPFAAGRIGAAQATVDALARIAPAGGFWIAEFCATMIIVDALQRLAATPFWRAVTAAAVLAGFAALAGGGQFDSLSLAQEFHSHRDAFAAELGHHVTLVLGSVVPALIVGIPLGIAALRRQRLRDPLFATLNLLQTIPSIALFALLIAPLTLLGLHGIGATPALIALTLYALLPIVRYTYTGLETVDASVIDSARAMGMTRGQLFRRVEVPLALPTLISGLRIVTVQGIGLAVVAALIGAGGLGAFIFQGIGQGAIDLVLLGAIPTIGLALAAEFALRVIADLLQRRVTR